jgi:hypothetical protein
MAEMIEIGDLQKPGVLAKLFNCARLPTGGERGFDQMTVAEATRILRAQRQPLITVLNGRVLNVDLSGEEFDPRLYDRRNGSGRATQVIEHLRQTGSVEAI